MLIHWLAAGVCGGCWRGVAACTKGERRPLLAIIFFFFLDANVVAAKTEAPVGGLVNVAEEQRDNVRADFGATL